MTVSMRDLEILLYETAIDALDRQIAHFNEHPLAMDTIVPGSTEGHLHLLHLEKAHIERNLKELREELGDDREVVDG